MWWLLCSLLCTTYLFFRVGMAGLSTSREGKYLRSYPPNEQGEQSQLVYFAQQQQSTAERGRWDGSWSGRQLITNFFLGCFDRLLHFILYLSLGGVALAPALTFNLAGAFLFRVLRFPEGCVGSQENNTEAYFGRRSFKRNIRAIS